MASLPSGSPRVQLAFRDSLLGEGGSSASYTGREIEEGEESRMNRTVLALCLLLMTPLIASDRSPEADDDEAAEDLAKIEDRLASATRVLNEVLDAPDRGLPLELLDRV